MARRYSRQQNLPRRGLTASQRRQDRDGDADALRVFAAAQSLAAARAQLMTGFGGLRLYSGHRDIYTAAGYDQYLTPEMCWARYNRQDVATRVVSAHAEETWRIPPMIIDGEDEKTGRTDTEFCKSWGRLSEGSMEVLPDGTSIVGISAYLYRADILCGIWRYAAVLLGIEGDTDLEEPLRPRKRRPESLLYTSVYAPPHVRISEFDMDRASRRFGLPLFYEVTPIAGGDSIRVHWTRILHIADNLRSDDIFGAPRLEPIWNRLIDLEKTMAGSGEAAWLLLNKGIVFSTRDGYSMPSDSSDLEDQIDEFIHGLRRTLQLEGMDTTSLGGQVTDPSGLVRMIVALISAATGIPQRILLGSERGELASTQDDEHWLRRIEQRQNTFATPWILRQCVNRLVWAGIMPKPSSGMYTFKWRALRGVDSARSAEAAKTTAEALKLVGATVEAKEFAAAFFDLPLDAIIPLPEPEPIAVGQPSDSSRNGDGKPVATVESRMFWPGGDTEKMFYP